MKAQHVLICIAFAITTNLSIAKAQAINVNDSSALVYFYNSTNGPAWNNHTNWLTAAPVSRWYGIFVQGTRVVSISMEGNNISGPVPSSFGKLTALTYLDLAINRLSGALPDSFGNLISLVNAGFYLNNFSGSIPSSIGNLINLQTLGLNSNYLLSGSIPSSIGNLTKLTNLNLEGDALTGSIPESMSNLQNLQELYLDINQLTGRIPPSLGKLSKLRILYLDYNHFTGTIPSNLSNDTSLVNLVLAGNNLTGNLPRSLLRLPHLTEIDAEENHLSADKEVPLDTTITTIDVAVNHNDYTFTGLESLAKSITQFYCSDQARIKVHQHNGVLAVSPGGTLSKISFYWQKVGAPAPYIVIKGDSTFHPTESGKYWVKINDGKVHGLVLLTDTATYTVPTVQNNISSAISVYPNPVHNTLLINGLDATSRSTIVVSDFTGTVWLSTVAAQQSAARYDVSRMPPGNYVITITNGKNVSTVKFMKE